MMQAITILIIWVPLIWHARKTEEKIQMEIVEKVTVINAQKQSSELNHMINSAFEGLYAEAYKVRGEKFNKLVDGFNDSINKLANRAFEAGREYERNK